ncbi:sulfurtransferase complex subunit TusC [Utexia brackfieldae]|uniref:sulfurtransferase complex subunit TusC n=1 Tax=Utexia brackfieldae TaxID=3074108 RepID=UPI00370DDDB0
MMKKIAIIISQPPHGSASGREALDAALALSVYHQISLFFIGDGVFHLLKNQMPNDILMRNYIGSFKLLELYDIEHCYALATDLSQRQITDPIIDIEILTAVQGQVLLQQQESIIRF